MYEKIHLKLDEILKTYSSEKYYDLLVEAKEKYFNVVGGIDEDDDDFEQQMNSFNEWYLFQYLNPKSSNTIIEESIVSLDISDEFAKCFVNHSFSLFEFVKKNRKDQIVLQDLIHRNKIILSTSHPTPALLVNDVFSGRILQYNEDHYLLKGICVFPVDVKSILKKESKKVRKKSDPKKESHFLLSLESMKNRWRRYGHIDVKKIFSFS